MRKALNLFVVFCALLLVAGCVADIRAQKQVEEYKTTLDPMLGKATRIDIARIYGEPQKQETVGEKEIWYYYKNYAKTKGGQVTAITPPAYESYDDMTFEFDRDGILRRYEVSVQR